MKFLSFLVSLISLILALGVWAGAAGAGVEAAAEGSVGAGIGIGRINISQELLPGGIYNLPQIPVLNTGSEGGTYEMGLSFLQDQTPRRPDSSWMGFSPQKFHLAAGETRLIKAELRLPTDTRPGDYFALLEVRRLSSKEGKVRIGPAAAAKLYFSVRAASVLGAVRARLLTFIETNPLIYLILAVALFLEAVSILRRHFRIQIEVKPNS